MKIMNAMIKVVTTIIVVVLYLNGKTAEGLPMPGLVPVHELLYGFPHTASQQTTVIRDVLGNQGTAYAYQNHNGFSASAVALSRSDNSKTLAFVPAVAPVLAAHHHHQPLLYAQDHYHHHPEISPAVAYSDYNGYYA